MTTQYRLARLMSPGAGPNRRRAHRPRAAAVSLLLVASVSGCMNAQPKPSAGSTVPAVPKANHCPASGVAVWIGAQDGAMGLRVVTVQMTNCGAAPYRVNGYPQIGLLDAAQRPLKVATHHGAAGGITDPGPSAVVLMPGEIAEAILNWRNTGTVPAKGALIGAYVAVSPTAKEAPQNVPLAVDVAASGIVNVTAWSTKPQLSKQH